MRGALGAIVGLMGLGCLACDGAGQSGVSSGRDASATGGSGAAAGGGATGSGSTGPGGTSGAAGAGTGGTGHGGADGAAGAGGGDPHHEAGASFDGATPAAACAAYVDAVCSFVDRCERGAFIDTYASPAECADAQRPSCLDLLGAPGAIVTPVDVQACAAQISSSACEGASLATMSRCSYKGTFTNGTACRYDGQCQSGLCKTASAALETASAALDCGVCSPFTPAGAACNTRRECGPGALCVNNACLPGRTKGQSCDTGSPCLYPYSCRGGTCQDPLAIGQPCNAVTDICDQTKDSECLPEPNAVCRVITRVTAGQACDPSRAVLCIYGLQCQGTTCAADPTGPCAGCSYPAFCANAKCMHPLAADCH
jgi:hypothetical protein